MFFWLVVSVWQFARYYIQNKSKTKRRNKRTKIFTRSILNWRIISKYHHNTKKSFFQRPGQDLHRTSWWDVGIPDICTTVGNFITGPLCSEKWEFAGDKSHFTPERSSGSEPWLGTMHAACRREQWDKFLLHTL